MNNKHFGEIRHLTLSYKTSRGEESVIEDLSLVFREGEKIALLGESGAGKSSLGRFLGGLLPSSATCREGSWELDGEMIFSGGTFQNLRKLRKGRIAYIFQDPHQSLNPTNTIGKHFEEIFLLQRLCPREEIEPRAVALLQSLGFSQPDVILRAYPFQLSGGMCQRVCIALCLCLQPRLLIADEPTSALDVVSASLVNEQLKNLKGTTLLLITHDISVALSVADRIVVLRDGKVCEDLLRDHFFKEAKHPYTLELLRSYEAIGSMKGKGAQNTASILRLEHLSKSYGNHTVLKDITLDVKEGEIFGLIGESGSGKSTMARLIMGLEKGEGRILFEGKDLAMVTNKERNHLVKRRQMIFQNSRAVLNPRRKVLDLVMEPLVYQHLLDEKGRRDIARHLLQKVGIDESHWEKKATGLSTGQCQRVCIARALSIQPKFLLCDEILSALDVTTQAKILKLLLELKEDFDLTIFMISHDMRCVKSTCSRIAILQGGALQGVYSTEELERVDHPYVRKLNEATRQ